MTNTATAILILLDTLTRLGAFLLQNSALINTANSENRDLTDDELASIKDQRKDAVQNFLNP